MIYEERTYTLHPGKVPEMLKTWEELALPVMPRILGNFVGYFYTDFGQLNQVVHIWGYDSHEERRRRRAELQASPDFQPYLEKALPLVQRQENRLLVPAPYSPLK